MTLKSRRGPALLVAALLAAQLGACAKKPAPQPAATPQPPPPVVQPTPPPPPPPPPRPTPQPPAPPRVPTDDEVFAAKTIAALNSERPLGEVYFGYDMADLTEVSRATIQKNAEWLRRWTSTRITIEGHSDSRGTNEYNLALGERRASAIRDYLIGLGIVTARVSIVSKGEEESVCKEDVESCWSQNRRGRFVITAK